MMNKAFLFLAVHVLQSANAFHVALAGSCLQCGSRLPCCVHMKGFGAATAKPAGKKGGKVGKKGSVDKTASLSPKKSWDRFKELVAGGAERHMVYAKLDATWHAVGEVAVGSGTAAQAAQFSKRLILEHAPRVVPALQLRAKELSCGLAGADGEPVLLTKQEVPEGIECGFEGGEQFRLTTARSQLSTPASIMLDVETDPEPASSPPPSPLNEMHPVCLAVAAPDATGKYTKVRGTTMKSDPTAIVGSAAR